MIEQRGMKMPRCFVLQVDKRKFCDKMQLQKYYEAKK
jgi:hypothetical protein